MLKKAPGSFFGRALFALAAAPLAFACLVPKTHEVDARYAAVHNALVATGLAQTGKVQRGSLAEGSESKVSVHLGVGCSTIAAFGGNNLRDIYVALIDTDGQTVAEDKGHDPDASIRYCTSVEGDFSLVVKSEKGFGDFLTSVWTGGASTGGPANADTSSARGTCAEPIVLADGITRGSTKRADNNEEGSCSGASGAEQVYQIRIDRPTLFRVGFEGRQDSILYLRKDTCRDESAEIACSADARAMQSDGGGTFAELLDKGVYYLFVDSYQNQEGSYTLDVSTKAVPPIEESCKAATPLPLGVPVSGTLKTDQVGFKPRCISFDGGYMPFAFDLPAPMRVRLHASSTEFHPHVFLRKDCKDAASESGCSALEASMNDAVLVTSLPAGHYVAFVGAENDRLASGRFTLEAEAAPEKGVPNSAGDACANAIEVKGPGLVSGDTFAASDDTTPACLPSNAGTSPELFYHFKVTKPTRFEAAARTSQGAHAFALYAGACTSAAIQCSSETLSRDLEPGEYWLAVEGQLVESGGSGAGSYDVEFSFVDTQAVRKACASAPRLERNKPLKGSIRGQSARFAMTCAPGGGSDRIYRIDIADAGVYEVSISGSFKGGMAIRETCADDRSELMCASSDDGSLSLELSQGTHTLVVKGADGSTSGDYELVLRRLANVP